MRKFISSLLICFSLCPMRAQTEMVVNPAYGDIRPWGTGKAESYDVAAFVCDGSLTGSLIKGVSIPLVSEGISDCSVWLASVLELSGGETRPDICEIDAVSEDGWLSVVFSEPYVIPAEGVYVGYSFTVNDIVDGTSEPVNVAEIGASGRFYVHSSRKYKKWGDYGLPYAADMQLTLEGDFHADAVSVSQLPELGGLHGEVCDSKVIIRNHGFEAVKSIEYVAEVGASTIEGRIDFPIPLEPEYFRDVEIPLSLQLDSNPGDSPYSFRVSIVNGVENRSYNPGMESRAYSYPYLPQRVPLVEEYTGVWCGWCPRGAVGMERMSALYPDSFVYAVYHKGEDPMATVDALPSDDALAPSAYIDRTLFVDPYNGLSAETAVTADDGIGEAWRQAQSVGTTGFISLKAQWSDSDKDVIDVDSRVSFVRRYSTSPYRVAYILTADGLHGEGPLWMQSNYYSGQEGYDNTELASLVDLPRHVADMRFDGVVVSATDADGVEGSLPGDVAMSEEYGHHYEFRVSDIRNLMGEELSVDKNRLHVIACIVNSVTGAVENCAISDVPEYSGISAVGASDDVSCSLHGDLLEISGVPSRSFVRVIGADGQVIYKGYAEGSATVRVPEEERIVIVNVNGRAFKMAR